MRLSSTSILGPFLAVLAAVGACSVDVGKLRAPSREDASRLVEDLALVADAGRRLDIATSSPDLSGYGAGGIGGLGSGGTTGGPDLGSSGDERHGSDVEDAPARNDARAEHDGDARPTDDADNVDSVANASDSEADGDIRDSGAPLDGAEEDAPGGQTTEVGHVVEAGANDDLVDAATDADVDLLRSDAQSKMTCPTTIAGALGPTDSLQIGRLSRIAPTAACGTKKEFPGNGADPTNLHLYDSYHFVNPTSSAVCMTFTLTYLGSQQLYAAAYSSFDPTDITVDYLGDVGAVLISPQTMGITVAGHATIDVVVYSTAVGTETAGAYTLSCTSQ